MSATVVTALDLLGQPGDCFVAAITAATRARQRAASRAQHRPCHSASSRRVSLLRRAPGNAQRRALRRMSSVVVSTDLQHGADVPGAPGWYYGKKRSTRAGVVTADVYSHNRDEHFTVRRHWRDLHAAVAEACQHRDAAHNQGESEHEQDEAT